ncbi:MAG: hypothetical protein ABI193_17830 [Minicystis sp.]
MICPNCRQDAPTVVRGVSAYCTACGAPRSLLQNTPVNVAGKPSTVGGSVAGVFGWVVLLGGLTVAAMLGALLQAIFTAGIVGYVFGIPIALLSLVMGLSLIFGGRKLRQSGEAKSKSAHEEAIFAIAQRRQGTVLAADVARALSMTEAEADALLTDLAKRPDGKVTLEVDDNGELRYMVPRFAPAMRVAAQPAPRVRVEPTPPSAELLETEELSEDEREALRRRMNR